MRRENEIWIKENIEACLQHCQARLKDPSMFRQSELLCATEEQSSSSTKASTCPQTA